MLSILVFAIALSIAAGAEAQSSEEQNGCFGTSVDPCLRSGTCSIQASAWSQTVTIDRGDLYDTMGWPGLCDQVHVALVRGDCAPGGSQLDVTAFLTTNSRARIPQITGDLACGADPAAAVPTIRQEVAIGLILGLVATATGLVSRLADLERG